MDFDRTLDRPARFRICFVCTGNICRSPMAEVVFRELAEAAGLGDTVQVLSAGTGDWHVGERADHRTLQSLAMRGYDGSLHRARQFDTEWFARLDLIVVADRGQERILKSWAQTDADRDKVRLLLGFDHEQASTIDVPDPYYSDAAEFDRVLAMVESACAALFRQLEPGLRALHQDSGTVVAAAGDADVLDLPDHHTSGDA